MVANQLFLYEQPSEIHRRVKAPSPRGHDEGSLCLPRMFLQWQAVRPLGEKNTPSTWRRRALRRRDGRSDCAAARPPLPVSSGRCLLELIDDQGSLSSFERMFPRITCKATTKVSRQAQLWTGSSRTAISSLLSTNLRYHPTELLPCKQTTPAQQPQLTSATWNSFEWSVSGC